MTRRTYPNLAKRFEARMRELGYENINELTSRFKIPSYEASRSIIRNGVVKTSPVLIALMKNLEYSNAEIRDALIEIGDNIIADLIVGHTERLQPWERALLNVTNAIKEKYPMFLNQVGDFLMMFNEIFHLNMGMDIKQLYRSTPKEKANLNLVADGWLRLENHTNDL